MERYKVLLVDDEEEIRLGISRRIDWNALGLELVGEADNGADALELAEQLRPDIVLTDIKMPFMDGLTLCGHLRQQLPTAKVVVFSGFDEFAYARKAIEMNVAQYILKPINAPELNEVLVKIKRELDERLAQQRDMEALRQRYEQSLPVLRELFLTRLLHSRMNPAQIVERAQSYDMTLTDRPCTVALVQVLQGNRPGGEQELSLLSVRSLLEKQLVCEGVQLLLYNDRIALICPLPQEQAVYELVSELNRICILVRSYLELSVVIGVGRVQADIQNLYLSAEQARSALDYRVLTGAQVLYLADLEPVGGAQLAFDENDERSMVAAVKLGSREDIDAIIDSLMPRMREAGTDLTQCQLFFQELTTCLVRLARSNALGQEEIFGKEFASSTQLTNFASLEEGLEWCRQCCLRLHSMLCLRRTDSNWRTVEQAKDYITRSYNNPDLDVEALCSHLHLSPAYFSTLFKRETDQTFIAFLTHVRMEEAVRLLRETDEKTYLIADKVGYVDPNYFSYVFKKRFGVSPSKYRSQLMP